MNLAVRTRFKWLAQCTIAHIYIYIHYIEQEGWKWNKDSARKQMDNEWKKAYWRSGKERIRCSEIINLKLKKIKRNKKLKILSFVSARGGRSTPISHGPFTKRRKLNSEPFIYMYSTCKTELSELKTPPTRGVTDRQILAINHVIGMAKTKTWFRYTACHRTCQYRVREEIAVCICLCIK